MAKIRDKKVAQLRWASVYCPQHGRSKVSMLSPISCPGCESERGRGDMLRRSRRKERRWKCKQHNDCGCLEEDGMGTSATPGGSV